MAKQILIAASDVVAELQDALEAGEVEAIEEDTLPQTIANLAPGEARFWNTAASDVVQIKGIHRPTQVEVVEPVANPPTFTMLLPQDGFGGIDDDETYVMAGQFHKQSDDTTVGDVFYSAPIDSLITSPDFSGADIDPLPGVDDYYARFWLIRYKDNVGGTELVGLKSSVAEGHFAIPPDYLRFEGFDDDEMPADFTGPADFSIVDGRLRVANDAGPFEYARAEYVFEEVGEYEVTVDYEAGTGSAWFLLSYGDWGGDWLGEPIGTTSGTLSVDLEITEPNKKVYIFLQLYATDPGAYCFFDNLRISEAA